MQRAVYPGSFDPVTNGHLDIIRTASHLFENLTVAVLNNPDKRCVFSVSERMDLIREAVEPFLNVEVDSFSGLLADYAKIQGIQVVVRGLRSVQDYEAEIPMAHMNRRLNHNLTTVLLPSSLQVADISSTLVRQIAMHGGDLSTCVPDNVVAALTARYRS